MIAVILAFGAGVTIVLSRSVNGLLASKVGAHTSTFFNYLTGTIGSLILVSLAFLLSQQPAILWKDFQPMMLIGGIIGVLNIMILNIVVLKISAVKLTLLAFIGQLASGIIIDYLLYDIFSLTKLIGCLIVTAGLILYQFSDRTKNPVA